MRKAIRIYGRVQGVWFRASAKSEADRLNLVGLIRNEQDGSVYAEAEGSAEDVESFIAWCNTGPELARVDKVQIKDMQEQGGGDGFEIER